MYTFGYSEMEHGFGLRVLKSMHGPSFYPQNTTIMKKLSLSYSLALFMCINMLWLGTSCEKQTVQPDMPTVAESGDSESPYADPANPNNPYDWTGQAHNNGLGHLGNFSQQIVDQANTNPDGAKQLVYDNLTSFYSAQYNLSGSNLAPDDFDLSNQQSVADAINVLPVSAVVRNHAAGLVNAISNMSLDDESSILPAVQMILDRENMVLNGPGMVQQDRIILLSAFSVFRWSAWFWIRFYYPIYFYHPWFWMQGHWGWWPYMYPYSLRRAWCIAMWDFYGALVGGRWCGPPCAAYYSAYYSALASLFYCR